MPTKRIYILLNAYQYLIVYISPIFPFTNSILKIVHVKYVPLFKILINLFSDYCGHITEIIEIRENIISYLF